MPCDRQQSTTWLVIGGGSKMAALFIQLLHFLLMFDDRNTPSGQYERCFLRTNKTENLQAFGRSTVPSINPPQPTKAFITRGPHNFRTTVSDRRTFRQTRIAGPIAPWTLMTAGRAQHACDIPSTRHPALTAAAPHRTQIQGYRIDHINWSGLCHRGINSPRLATQPSPLPRRTVHKYRDTE
ncbi:hypothetical protein J6590_021617 [Homalodisca vitripennis]|nr:hypothetical protein J6590_021617 [Homalodisca vitripennis]